MTSSAQVSLLLGLEDIEVIDSRKLLIADGPGLPCSDVIFLDCARKAASNLRSGGTGNSQMALSLKHLSQFGSSREHRS